MKRNTYKAAAVAVTCVLASIGLSRDWNKSSDPTTLEPTLSRRLESLPNTGALDGPNLPWSDGPYPDTLGGVAYEWNLPGAEPRAPLMPTRSELIEGRFGPNRGAKSGAPLRTKEIAELAATVKLDLYRGRYDYPLTHLVLRTAKQNAPEWSGVMLGWASASINHAEPAAINVMNSDQIVIPFGSSDVKALMAYYYGVYALQKRNTRAIGNGLEGVNAGAFHLLLANTVGLQEQSFLAEFQIGPRTRTMPIAGYRSVIGPSRTPTKGAAKKAVTEHSIETEVEFVDEGRSSWLPAIETDRQKIVSLTYRYRLELDREGRIIGGEFEEGSPRPSQLMTVEPMKFEGEFQALNDIFTPAALEYVKPNEAEKEND